MTTAAMTAAAPSYPLQAVMAACLEFWRTVWFDLPLAWLIQVECAAAGIVAAGGPTTPLQAVAIGLGCQRPPVADPLQELS